MRYQYTLGEHGDHWYVLLKPGPATSWGYLCRYPKGDPFETNRQIYTGGRWYPAWQRRHDLEKFDAETAQSELAMMALGEEL